MRRLLYFLTIILLSSSIAIAQQEKVNIDELFDDAEYFFSTGDYQEAVFLFLKLTGMQPDNANYNFRTGMTYLNIPGQETKAIPYLEKAVLNISLDYKPNELTENKAPHHSLFYLGNAYRINNNLDKALESYNRFKSLKDFEKKYNIRIVESEIKACERAKIIIDSPLNLVKTNLGTPVNTANSDYSPILTHDENTLVFMSSLRFYEAIMFSRKIDGVWSTPININSQVRSDGDMVPTSLSPNGNELLLVKKDETNSDIYLSKFDGNLWSEAIPLNKNINTRSNETSASMSPDGKSLYFASDQKGTLGGLDIFVSRKQSVGDWGPPENLGPAINTELDEDTPYMGKDGKTLFFSSKGHFNMGGYDVFYAVINKYNQFEEAINLGYPINTTSDNRSFFPVKDGKTGYMSLFDENNIGKEDIFKLEILPFTEPKPVENPEFDKNFIIILNDIENSGKIEIIYDKKSDLFKVKSSDGKTYKITVNYLNK